MKQVINRSFVVIVVGITFFIEATAFAGLLYTYNELTLKNLEQMTHLVRGKISESKKSRSGQLIPLKEAFQAVFSRPDDDGMIEKVIPPLISELEHLKGYEKTVEDLAQEALDALSNPKNFKPRVQVTYILFLENMIAQLRPRLQEGSFERKILEKISQGNIVLSKEARSERRLRSMRETRPPSEIAREVLEGSLKQPTDSVIDSKNVPAAEPETKPETSPK